MPRARQRKAKRGGAKGRVSRVYRVFISHSGEDMWLAEQLARAVEACGATAFLDVRDIPAGDDFKQRIKIELPKCQELLALFTPWSRQRAWVRHEMGMADGDNLRIVCVFYHVKTTDFSGDEGGLGPLNDLNIVDINNIETYLKALSRRVSSQ